MSEEQKVTGRHRAYEQEETFIQAWQWNDPVLRNVTDILLAAVQGRTGRALDVGCGTGRSAIALARAGLAVEGLDIDPKVIAIAQRASQQLGVSVDYCVADFSGDCAAYPDDTYDVVVCMEVLEHIPDWQQTLTNLKRVVKRGGFLFLTVPHDPSQFSLLDEYAGHLRRFRKEEIVDQMDGFDIQVRTLGFPCFRAITWLYDRALRLGKRKHAPERLWRESGGYRLLMPRILYLLCKFDNLFSDLSWGSTLLLQGNKR